MEVDSLEPVTAPARQRPAEIATRYTLSRHSDTARSRASPRRLYAPAGQGMANGSLTEPLSHYNTDEAAHQPKGNKRKMDTEDQDVMKGGERDKISCELLCAPQSGRGVSSLAGETPRHRRCKARRRRHPCFQWGGEHSFRPAGIAGLPVIKFKFSPKQEGLGRGQAGPVAVDKAAPAPFFTVILFVKIGGVEHKKRPNGQKRSGIMDAKKLSYLTRKELVLC